MREVYTTGQLARAMGFCPRTIVRFIDRGLFPGAYRMPGSRHRRVPAKALRAFQAAHPDVPVRGLGVGA